MIHDQIEKSYRDHARKKGAKWAVVVKQTDRGNSEDHSKRVAALVATGPKGLVSVTPGGDSWDNPPICCAVFTEKSDAVCWNNFFENSVMFPLEEANELSLETNFEMVLAFQEKFGLEMPADPALCGDELFQFRYKFFLEELSELNAAYRNKDLLKFADAIADILYITYGLAGLCGIPIDEVFKVVHEANMKKERATGDDDARGTRGSRYDVVKPAGWKPPDIGKILNAK